MTKYTVDTKQESLIAGERAFDYTIRIEYDDSKEIINFYLENLSEMSGGELFNKNMKIFQFEINVNKLSEILINRNYKYYKSILGENYYENIKLNDLYIDLVNNLTHKLEDKLNGVNYDNIESIDIIFDDYHTNSFKMFKVKLNMQENDDSEDVDFTEDFSYKGFSYKIRIKNSSMNGWVRVEVKYMTTPEGISMERSTNITKLDKYNGIEDLVDKVSESVNDKIDETISRSESIMNNL